MSAFVLNRNYELQLPNIFVDVDREEMEYVDGGWKELVKYWWGYAINLSTRADCQYWAEILYNRSNRLYDSSYISGTIPTPVTVGASVFLSGTAGNFKDAAYNLAMANNGATLSCRFGYYSVDRW